MQSKNKLIVVDGIDRSGKTTAINKLVEDYKDEYNVVTLLINNTQLEFKKFFKTLNNNKLYDTIFASNIFSTYINIESLLELNKNHDKPLMIIIGRFYISGIVNGLILRKNTFKESWCKDTKLLHESEYARYIKAFELEIKKLDIKYFYFIVSKPANTTFEQDDENEYITISQDQMQNLNNSYYRIGLELLNKDYINLTLESKNEFETYDKIKYYLCS